MAKKTRLWSAGSENPPVTAIRLDITSDVSNN